MNHPPTQQIGLLLWLITPLITALLLRAFAGDGSKDFGLRPSFKSNAIWYTASLLIYPLVAVLMLAIGGGRGDDADGSELIQLRSYNPCRIL